jgi:hypothetical protein
MRFKLVLFFLLLITKSIYALEPWFTGPLLAEHALVKSAGHEQILIFVNNSHNYGIYDTNHTFVKTPMYYDSHILVQYIYGLSKDVDVEFNIDYRKNENEGKTYSRLADSVLMIGYQLLRQNGSVYNSDLRLLFSLILPTGRWDSLNPSLHTTDATGFGSYQPAIGLVFSHLFSLKNGHYLTSYLEANIRYASTVKINGLSAYGGTKLTQGHIRPGNSTDFNIVSEYDLTQNWALCMEAYVYAQQGSVFNGIISDDLSAFVQRSVALRSRGLNREILFNQYFPNMHNIGNRFFTGNNSVYLLSIAPAIEYNFSKSFGLIGGAWLSLAGKNHPAFVAPVIGIVKAWG